MPRLRDLPGGVPGWPRDKVRTWISKCLQQNNEIPLPQGVSAEHSIIKQIWGTGFPGERNATSHSWSEEEVEFVLKAHEDKWPHANTALYLGRSVQSLRLKLMKKLREGRRGTTPQTDPNVVQPPSGTRSSSRLSRRRSSQRAGDGDHSATQGSEQAGQQPLPGTQDPPPGTRKRSSGSRVHSAGTQDPSPGTQRSPSGSPVHSAGKQGRAPVNQQPVRVSQNPLDRTSGRRGLTISQMIHPTTHDHHQASSSDVHPPRTVAYPSWPSVNRPRSDFDSNHQPSRAQQINLDIARFRSFE